MLPVKAGSLILSEESKQKLDLFYRRYCTGENKELYGISHIIYACHAAFPMLLSPELANLTWLNFNSYIIGEKSQKIDRLVVSDFLLSPLLRPVANRQFELLPEIRTYLLYLLKDARWFKLFGITGFGETRINALAQFLRQYLSDKKSNAENNALGFKEVNEWTALSYLEPDLLAVKMAAAFRKTFVEGEDKANDEHGQLRLNMLMDRFGQQINLNIHSKAPGNTRAFINLHSYSKANKALLFEKSETEISNLFYELETSFIGDKNSADTTIQLPISKGVEKRLERKKHKIQRVVSVVIGIDNYHTSPLNSSKNSVEQITMMLEVLKENINFKIEEPITLLDNEATREKILGSISDSIGLMNPEDILLIYYSGHGVTGNKAALVPVDADLGQLKNLIDRSFFYDWFPQEKEVRKKQFQTVFILDACGDGFLPWVGADDIQFAAVRNEELQMEQKTNTLKGDSWFSSNLNSQLQKSQGKITYNNLQQLLKLAANDNKEISETPVFLIPDKYRNNFFLSGEAPVQSPGFFLISYNHFIDAWCVADEDFVIMPTNATAYIYDYETRELIEGGGGEIFVRNKRFLFGGATTGLNKNKLYWVRAKEQQLYFSVSNDFSLVTAELNPSKAAAHILEIEEVLSKTTLDTYSLWKNLENYQADESNADISYSLKISPRIEITIAPMNDSLVYKVVFLNRGEDTEPAAKMYWVANDLRNLFDSIEKLSQYFYVNNLQLPKQFGGNNKDDFGEKYTTYSPLWVEVNHKWPLIKDQNSIKASSRTLILDKECFKIENGEIVFNPFGIEIVSHEPFPLFYEVYLMISDFLIKRISLNKVNRIEAGQSIDIEWKDDAIVERVLMGEVKIQVKILLSRDPITIDFSQTGI
jgi:hypothetical protein